MVGTTGVHRLPFGAWSRLDGRSNFTVSFFKGANNVALELFACDSYGISEWRPMLDALDSKLVLFGRIVML